MKPQAIVTDADNDRIQQQATDEELGSYVQAMNPQATDTAKQVLANMALLRHIGEGDDTIGAIISSSPAFMAANQRDDADPHMAEHFTTWKQRIEAERQAKGVAPLFDR